MAIGGNKGGGKTGGKTGGKIANKDKKGKIAKKRKLLLKADIIGTEYGQVVKVLGSRNFIIKKLKNIKQDIENEESDEIFCHLGGGNKRQIKDLTLDEIVLFGPRDFQPSKGDIVYRYTSEEVRELKKMNEFITCKSVNDFSNIEHEELVSFNFDEI